MASNIPITNGQGQSSVAAEEIGSLKYQQIKVVGGQVGSTSVWGINPDRSAQVSVVGVVSANVTGSIATIQSGTQITSVVSTVPSSVLVGASIFGQLPAGTAVLGSVATLQGTNPWVIVGSVYGTGSVVAFQGGAPWANTNVGSVITVWQNSSILSVPVGSTIAVLQSPSIVGTYAEDAAHTTGEKGVFALGVRNDTQTSITSADGDYSPLAVGPTGAVIATDSPITKWVQGTADLRVVLGASVTAIVAQGASVFTYIREIQVANMGSASVLVTFAGGLGSILGYTIAPAGGGSNFITRLKTGENSAFTASISGTASVLVSAQGFTAKI